MDKLLRITGILAIVCFSFYFTEQAALFMRKKDPLYESILAVKEEYKEDFVNAKITDEYIVPGFTGLEVDIEKSFQNMKYLGYFQTSSLVFQEIEPTISLAQNKDKIIRRGNSLKQALAIVLSEEQLISYLEEMGISYNVLTTKETMNYHRAYGTKINVDWSSYDEVEKTLKKNKEKNDLCFISNNHKEDCLQKDKWLIEESLKITKNNFSQTYNKIVAGDIIYIQDNIGLPNLKILLETISFKGLRIISLPELLKESRQ